MSRTSTVTSYGLASVTLTSLLDIPGCNIEAFEPVSRIRLLDMPSILTEMKGVPYSNTILTGLIDSFFGDSEAEGAVFIHASSFPETLASRLSSRLAVYGGFFPEKRGRLGPSLWSLFLGEFALLASLLSRVEHSSEVPYTFAFITF